MHAYFADINFVRPYDIDSVAENALCHRLMLRTPYSASAAAHGSVAGGAAGSGSQAGNGALGSSPYPLMNAAAIYNAPYTARTIIQHLIRKVLLPPK